MQELTEFLEREWVQNKNLDPGQEWKVLLEGILEGIQEGFALVDGEGKKIFVNEQFCRQTGFTREELLHKRPPFDYWPEEERKEIESVFRGVIGRDGAQKSYRFRFMRKSGERYSVMVTPGNLTVNNANRQGSFALVQDMTDLDRFEESMHSALEREKELSVLKSNLIRALSHEFRTPLAVILNSADLIDQIKMNPDSEKSMIICTESLEKIRTQVERLVDILNGIEILGMNREILSAEVQVLAEGDSLVESLKEELLSQREEAKNSNTIPLKHLTDEKGEEDG